MQNKHFSLGNYHLLNLLCSFASFVLVVFGLFTVYPLAPIYVPVQAEGNYLSPSTPVSATISMDISSDVNVSPVLNGSFISNTITSTVTTNNYTGYQLTSNLSGTNTNLTHTTLGSSTTIPSITANYTTSSFPANYWGVSIDNTNYSPLPVSTNSPMIIKNQTSAATNQSSNLYVGTKVSSTQTSGDYTNDIVLTSLVNTANYSITYNKNTTDEVSNLPSVQQGQVSSSANALSSLTPTRTGYTFLGWSESSTATSATYSAGGTFYLDATKNNTNINLYAVWQINTYTVTFNINEAGYGTVSRSTQTVNYGSAVSTSGATATVAGTATTASAASQTAQYSYAFSSWTNNCGSSVTGNCTITANFSRSTLSYYFDLNGYLDGTSSGNISGYGTADVYINGSLAANDVTDYYQQHPYGTTYEIKDIKTTAGHIYNGVYSGSLSGTITGSTGVSLNFTTKPFDAAFANAGKTRQNGFYKMQDMTASICSAVAAPTTITEDISTQLIDTRDNKVYWVTKLADGKCWMTQNLDLNLSASTTLTNENTDLNSVTSWTPVRSTINATSNMTTTGTPGTITGWANDYNTPYSIDVGNVYFDGIHSNTSGCSYFTTNCEHFKNTQYTLNNEHGHVGNYYNWPAVVASNDTSGFTTAYADYPNSICPKGWRLPHGSGSVEGNDFGTLNTAYGGITNSDQTILSSPLFFVRAGYAYSSSLNYTDYAGSYWTSTANSSYDAQNYNFYYSEVDINGRYISNGRLYGLSVRCVAR